MIHTLRFRNFKGLRDVEIGLDRFTLLVGQNGAGKTSVLEGIHHLTRLASTDPRRVFSGRADVGVIASRGAVGAFALGLDGAFRGRRGDLSVSFASVEDYPFSDTYKLEAALGDRRFVTERELAQLDDSEAQIAGPFAASPLALVLREAAFLRFDAARLAEPAYSDLPVPTIAPDGEGLAAVLADMAVSRPDDFQRLQDTVRAIVPELSRVRLLRAKVTRRGPDGAPADPAWGHEIVFDTLGATDVPARAAGEGTLVVLGLFAALIGPERHQIVLVDHLERGLSPRSLAELVDQIDLVLAQDPKLQIVAVTDSPVLLDRVDGRRVRVHARLADGSTRVRPMTAMPDFEALRRTTRPGELWLTRGEAWVVEDRPHGIASPALGPPASTRRFPLSMPPLPGSTGGARTPGEGGLPPPGA